MKKTDPLDERGLPASLESEKLILAAILRGALDYRDCRAALEPSDFALQAHRTIYEQAGRVMERGVGVDRVTVAETLRDANLLDEAGGLAYLVDLDLGMPIMPRLEDYIRTVRDKAILRRTIVIAEAIRSEAILDQGDSSELLMRAERMMCELGLEASRTSEFHQPGEVIRARGGLDGYLKRGQQAGVPTGFEMLDELTCGIRPGQLWVVAGVTGGGKSTFARNVTLNAARRGHPSAFITLEMTEDEVTDGLICSAGQINTQIIRRGMDFERSKVRDAAVDVADLPIYIRDQASASIPKIHGELRKLKAEKGITLAVVDYLQLMTPVGRFGNRTEEIGHLSRGLKLIAHDLKIGVIALSQIKRLGDVPRRPQLNDLRESGSIENDANTVIFVYSEWQSQPMDEYPTEVIVAKQRGGPVGTLPFMFRKATGTFYEGSGR
jgi:replicative DNA helicase